jgi:5-methylcytosine-specific restriction endonuclease McrA
LTNVELESRLTKLVKEERALTQEILSLIRLGDQRRIYLERGFPNVYSWLVRGYGFSHGAAHRRIQAARLLECVPEAKEKLATGEVNLSTLAQIQSAIKQEEKRAGMQVTQDTKQALVEKIEVKSAQQTEQILRTEFPDLKQRKESLRPVDAESYRLTVILEKDAVEALQRVKELLSHSKPGASSADLIKHLALDYVRRNDPLQKKKKPDPENKPDPEKKSESDTRRGTEPQPSMQAPAAVRRAALQRAGGKCEYKDPQTGRVCGSAMQVEMDHRWPRALGGGHELSNIRCLCKQHNLLAAEQILGAELMSRYRATDR